MEWFLFLSATPQILRKAYYKSIESSLKLINPYSNIIDFGASYGLISIVLSKAVNDKSGKVFSLEAEYDIESYRSNYNRKPNLIASTKKLNSANLL